MHSPASCRRSVFLVFMCNVEIEGLQRFLSLSEHRFKVSCHVIPLAVLEKGRGGDYREPNNLIHIGDVDMVLRLLARSG